MSGFFIDQEQQAIIDADRKLYTDIIPLAIEALSEVEERNRTLRERGISEPQEDQLLARKYQHMIIAAQHRVQAIDREKEQAERQEMWGEYLAVARSFEVLGKRMRDSLEKGAAKRHLHWGHEMRDVMEPWAEKMKQFLETAQWVDVTVEVNTKK